VQSKPSHAGIRVRHARSCRTHAGGRCNCRPTYEAWAWSSRDRKKVRRSFPTLAAAKGWRTDAVVGLRRGTMRAPTPVTVREAAEAWLKGARDGTIRTRSGDKYKPSALRGYEAALRSRILPDFGGAKLSAIMRVDLQDLADRLVAEGLDPSTIRNTLMPVRAIFRRAVARGEIAVNPTTGLELPAVRGKRDHVASPAEAERLLGALPDSDRALWATALYAGVRRGELQALEWPSVDMKSGVLRIERSWDDKERIFIDPKSSAGRRVVPIPAVLRAHLIEHRLRTGRSEGLVFGSAPNKPFAPSAVWRRARRAWAKAELEPIGLHEARHTFASLMIAAGVNAKALSSYMGHSSVVITYDRYGHLMPGNEGQAVALLDAYLEKALLDASS
jgi:integrase